MRWLLARHGQTDWNLEARVQGHVDRPLDDFGMAQAHALGKGLMLETIDEIWSSDLERAYQTAQAVADLKKLEVMRSEQLRERSFGTLEGMPYAEFRAEMDRLSTNFEGDAFRTKPPEGESLFELGERIAAFINAQPQTGTRLVVTHGGTCSVFLSLLLQGDIQSARSFRFNNCGYSEVIIGQDGKATLTRYNVVEHLSELANAEAHGTLS